MNFVGKIILIVFIIILIAFILKVFFEFINDLF